MFSKTVTGRPLVLVACLMVVGVSCLAATSDVAVAQTAPNTVTVAQNAATVGRYDIYELTLENATHYDNPWEDPAITAVFTSPTGSTYTVGGFLDDTKNQTNTWKVRFAPQAVGAWTWSLSFANTMDKNPPFVTSGKFTSVASANTGFLRVHPCNNRRFMTEGDGQAFYPLTSTFAICYAAIPMNKVYWCTDDSWQPTKIDDYMSQSKNSGRNTVGVWDVNYNYAWTADILDKGGFNVNGSGKNRYNLDFTRYWEDFLAALHRADMKVFFTCGFTTPPAFEEDFNKSPADPAVKQAWLNYHQYMINRYGAYVDVWRLYAHRKPAPKSYLETMAPYMRAHDPYQHLLTASPYPTDYDGLDVICEVPTGGGNAAKEMVHNLEKSRGKVNPLTGLEPPLLMSLWYNRSGYGTFEPEMHRLGLWPTFFNRGAVAYFDVGPGFDWDGRALDKIFSDYVADFDPAAKPATLAVSPSGQLDGSGLSSPKDLGMYFLHLTSKHAVLSGATVEVNVPADNMRGQWLDPATGNFLEKPLTLKAGPQKISIPPFKNDIALRLHGGGPATTIQFNNSSWHVNGDQAQATLSVNRLGDTSGAVTVNYATRDSLAKAGKDYKATTGTVSWAAGEAGPKTITVPLIATELLRPNLDFLVDLSQPTGGAGLGTSRSALVAVLNTVVNTVEPMEKYRVVANGAGKIDFTVKRIGKGIGPLTLYCSTGGQSARDGVDFVGIAKSAPKKLEWAEGDMSPRTFSVKILDNPKATGDREFEVNLPDYVDSIVPVVFPPTKNTTAPLVAGSAPPKIANTMVIIQQDPKLSPGVLSFKGNDGYVLDIRYKQNAHYTVSGTESEAVIPVERTHGSHGEVSVKYTTTVGTAAKGINFQPVKGVLTWADGDTADKLIKIPLVHTPGETGKVTIWLDTGNPTGGALWGIGPGSGRGYGSEPFAVVTIVYPESK